MTQLRVQGRQLVFTASWGLGDPAGAVPWSWGSLCSPDLTAVGTASSVMVWCPTQRLFWGWLRDPMSARARTLPLTAAAHT